MPFDAIRCLKTFAHTSLRFAHVLGGPISCSSASGCGAEAPARLFHQLSRGVQVALAPPDLPVPPGGPGAARQDCHLCHEAEGLLVHCKSPF